MASTLELTGEERDRRIAESFKEWLGRHSERKRSRLAEHARVLVEETSLVSDMRDTRPVNEAELASIAAPTLALYGEHSDLRASSEPLLRVMPNAQIQILEGCTHSILWEATAQVRARVLAFLRDPNGGSLR